MNPGRPVKLMTSLEGSVRFLLTLALVSALGVLVRWAASPEKPLLWYILGGLFLLLPMLVLALLCWQQRSPAVRWGAGLGGALASAYCNFVLLDPQYNQDANIGLGLYWIGGWIVVLVPAALLGAALGWLLGPRLPRLP